jgi:stage V sporulation protein B
MTKVEEIGQVSAKGSFNLLYGLVISNLISAVGTIFIGRILGPNLYGLYSIALVAPSLLMNFRDWGVSFAMVRFSAQYRANGRTDELRSVILSGLIFEISLGLILSVISFVLADFFAGSIFNRPDIASLIQVASLSIIGSALITSATAVFTGIDKLHLNSLMVICQSIVKTVLTLVLLIIGLTASGAVIGFTVASLIAGLIGLVLIASLYGKLPKTANLKLEIKAYLRELLKYGVPISVSVMLIGFLTQFYSFLLPIYYHTDNVTIGNYGIAQNFVVLIGFFAIPITTMMLPAFAKLDYQKDKEALRSVFQFSVKYASIFVVPVTALVMCLSEPAVSTLFGNTYSSAALFLTLLAISYLFAVFGSLSTNNLINSQGQTKVYLKLNLLTAAIGFPLGSFLILQFGVLGLIVSSLTIGLPSLFISLYWIKKHYSISIDWRSSAKIVLSSAIAATVTYLAISQPFFASWIRLLLGIIIFVFVLIPSLLLTKAVTREDIVNLKLITGKLGLLSRVINKILGFFEKIMNVLKV